MIARVGIAVVFALSLVGCGGGASSHAVLPGASQGATTGTNAQFVIKVPPKTGTGTGRGPAYVSPSTQSVSMQVDSGTPIVTNLTPGSPDCNVPAPLSPLICTLPLVVAAGTHTFTFTTYDGLAGAGNVLSTNSAPFTVVANQANVVNLTLAGVPASLLVEPGSGDAQIVGSGSVGFQFTGEVPHTVIVLPQDADGNLILGPGAPTISASVTGASSGSGLSVAPASGNPNAFTLSSTGFGTASLSLVATPAAASAGSALNASVSLDATVYSSVIAGGGGGPYADGTGAAAGFDSPAGVAVDTANNNLYVADTYACSIRQVTTAGVVTTPYGPLPPNTGVCGATNGTGNAVLFDRFYALAYDSANGNLYEIDAGYGCGLRQITASGVVTTLAGGTTCGYADGTGSAAEFSGSTGGIVYDPTDSDLYVDDTNNCAIRQVTLSGVVTTVAGNPPPTASCGTVDATGTAARFYESQGIAYDSVNQSLYVTDRYRVRQVTVPGYVVTTIAGPVPPTSTLGFTDGSGSAASFSYPFGITYDSTDGNLYVVDSRNAAIRQVTPAGVVTTIAGSTPPTPSYGAAGGFGSAAQFEQLYGVAYDAATNALYVTDERNTSIVQVQL
uniref:NHL repeat protein n=1 Tax=mine drainage metagenome TaxID=410659 RepID=E6Q5W1_9ZZZZ